MPDFTPEEALARLDRLTDNNVLIRYDVPKEELIAGSLLFMPAKRQEFRFRGTIVAVGPGEKRWLERCEAHADGEERWTRKPMELKPGMRVYFERGAGHLLDGAWGPYLVARDTEITALLDETLPKPSVDRLFGHNLLIQYDKTEERPSSGGDLIMMPSTRLEVRHRGTVLKVGPGRRYLKRSECGCHTGEWGVRPVTDAAVGSRVLYGLGEGTDYGWHFGPFVILEEQQLVAVLEDGADAVLLGTLKPDDLYPAARLGHA